MSTYHLRLFGIKIPLPLLNRVSFVRETFKGVSEPYADGTRYEIHWATGRERLELWGVPITRWHARPYPWEDFFRELWAEVEKA